MLNEPISSIELPLSRWITASWASQDTLYARAALSRKETCNSSKGLCRSVASEQSDTWNELQCTKEWTQIRRLNHLEHPLVRLEGKTVCERLYPVSLPKDSWMPLPDQGSTDWWHWGVIDSVRACVASGGHGSLKQATWGDKPGQLHRSGHNTPIWPVSWPGCGQKHIKEKRVKAIIKPIFGAKSHALCKYTKVIMRPATFDLFTVDGVMRALCWKSGWWFRPKCPTSCVNPAYGNTMKGVRQYI